MAHPNKQMRQFPMRNLLLAATLGLASTATLADAGHSDNAAKAEVDRTISVTAGDIWFKPDNLAIAPGETVKFVIKNTGNLKHEFVVGTAEKQEAHRTMMRQMASGQAGHDMAGGHHNAMPSVTIPAGETRVLVWTAPETSDAALVYACNIPGHYEAGMRGKFALQG